MKLNDEVSKIKNIGEKRAELLNKLKIFTVKDILEHYPRHYEDRSKIKKVEELLIDETNTFTGIISNSVENIKVNNKNISKLKISDETGEFEIIWFNRPYLKKYFKKGNKYIFFGKIKDNFGRIQMENPDYEEINEKELLHTGRIVPIYPATKGLSQKIFRGIIKNVVDEFSDTFKDFLPKYIRDEYNICDKDFAVKNIHFPINDDAFFIARQRLVFEEFFLLQSSLLKLKGTLKNEVVGAVFSDTSADEIISNLPYSLTKPQTKVFSEIVTDVKSGFMMNRLIQGDVGSGKTLVAILAAYIAIKNGYQACIMVPTEVLAMQHLETFTEIFSPLGIKTVLLTGSQKKKERRRILEDIECGFANMIVGTHAIIQDTVNFDMLGLVITDEQHRFGVKQREKLSKKGDKPHTIVMTATPIPRTLALILYGDLDISIIDELPPGRQKIDTFFVSSSYMKRLLDFIKKEVSFGRQCYVICPMIEDLEGSDLKSVMTHTEDLKKHLPNIEIEFIHGKMKQEYKNYVMQKFSENEINVVVSTTVIEVGINVPNATLMIIENAERFGLSQLHQLRGRVGRGTEKSYCILISDTKNKQTKERLNAMVKSNDGFYISELDLKLRGPGDFFGTRQHGLPELKIANLYKDMEILEKVQRAVHLENEKLTKNEKEAIENEIKKYLFSDSENILL